MGIDKELDLMHKKIHEAISQMLGNACLMHSEFYQSAAESPENLIRVKTFHQVLNSGLSRLQCELTGKDGAVADYVLHVVTTLAFIATYIAISNMQVSELGRLLAEWEKECEGGEELMH